MSVEPVELMSEIWTQWQGHVIDGMFPLGRYLGCSDHSGVFLTNSAALGPADMAIKLVPIDRHPAQSQLAQWERAGGIVHPHLLRLFQCGVGQLDGLPYLYVVMEYADQTLEQVLQRRALTDDEAREMLRPILYALEFLHGQSLVQGQLKPANILVVGDQLKLASDTIRRVGEDTISAKTPTRYDPPEARFGSNSTAADVWTLGVCLFEALTRRTPSVWGERSEAVALPAHFSPAFRDVVARCLNPSPQNRPSVTELVAWDRGHTASAVPDSSIQPAVPAALESATSQAPPQVAPATASPGGRKLAPALLHSPNLRPLLTALLGALVIAALAWVAGRMVKTHRSQAPVSALQGSMARTPDADASGAADAAKPAAAMPANSGLSGPAAANVALHEELPEISESARRAIRGHVKLSVRIIVDANGSVITATADRIGRSRYFQRVAIEAARKWTFPAIDSQSRRVMQIHFDFSREETTARAVMLN